ncbi:winged helix-turn-helix domain-containing protein [Methanoregula sp.]|uniref:winged helix-turn-helix domain-containing protein n=1 Tax=Methanoregula sp. TaxID=2052170 RepID=UPI002CD19879|nr:winged helix-turn-helix domain-containing protein [Methanoregula sp.]HVP96769.1 winged helix-turn-helix domain-containing protein [Methanoregula sp.]
MTMAERRTSYEIYWEILVYCRTPRSFTTIIGRCDLNSKTGQEYLGFLVTRGFLALEKNGEKSTYVTTEKATEYIALFTRLYQGLFDKGPEFRV